MADVYTAPRTWTAAQVVAASELNTDIRDNLTAIVASLNGDGSADADVTHAHGAGTLANRPAAGTAGRLYTCTDLGVTYQDDGTDWNYAYRNPTKCEYFFDDFLVRPAVDATSHYWRAAGDTGGTAISIGPVDDDRSIVRLDKGTDANTRIGIGPRTAAIGFLDIDARASTFLFEFMVRANASAGNIHVCLTDTAPDHLSTGGNNQIGVRKVGTGAWETLVRNGSANAHNDQLETDDTDWHKCRIELTDANTLDFYWTSSESGAYGSAAQSYDLSGDTTLTAARLSIYYGIGATGTTARTTDMDYILLASQRY